MADDCCHSGDGCCAPPPLQFPESEAGRLAAPTSCETDAACGCRGGVPRFDGIDPHYKRVLWTVIAINGAMFLTEMIAGQLAGSQALKADALDFFADTVTYGLSLAVIGASLKTRATAALLKGSSLSLMALWVFGSTIYHTIILGLPSAQLMGESPYWRWRPTCARCCCCCATRTATPMCARSGCALATTRLAMSS